MGGKQQILSGQQPGQQGPANTGGPPGGLPKKVRAVSAYNAYWQARAGMIHLSPITAVPEEDPTVWPQIHPD
jgi:hypothetical protein